MRSLSLILLFITLSAFTRKQVPSEPVPSPSPIPTIPVASPAPQVGVLNFTPVAGYATKLQAAKIASASTLVYKVMHSACFVDFMLHRKLIQTNGRTPAQVIEHLQGLGATVPVKMYYRSLAFTSAVAYRQPPSTTINLNSAAFGTGDSDCYWAATLAHEGAGHAVGNYDHDYKWSLSRSFSVPYSLGGADASQGGDVFDHCCKEIQ